MSALSKFCYSHIRQLCCIFTVLDHCYLYRPLQLVVVVVVVVAAAAATTATAAAAAAAAVVVVVVVVVEFFNKKLCQTQSRQ